MQIEGKEKKRLLRQMKNGNNNNKYSFHQSSRCSNVDRGI